jgi:hypothetical protein
MKVMKLLISGYFDTGISFGIDDTVFNTNRDLLNSLRNDIKYLADDDSEKFEGININIGKGIRIDLGENDLTENWREQAILEAETYFNDDNLMKSVKLTSVKNFYLDLFSVGIAFVSCEVTGLNEYAKMNITDLYQCYEYAAYKKLSEELVKEVGEFIAKLGDKFKEYALCKRKDITKLEDIRELLPGFVCIVIEESKNVKTLKTLQDYEWQYDFKELKLDDGKVFLGWSSALIIPQSNDLGLRRILYLFKISQVYYGICEAFESVFISHMTKSINQDFSGKNGNIYSVPDLNKLRTLAISITTLTVFSSTSNNISDLCFFDFFNQHAKLEHKHDRIRMTCEVFSNIQFGYAQFEDEVREKKLNTFIFYLTAFTLISVMADIINTLDYIHELLPSPLIRLPALFVLPLILIGFAYWKYMVGNVPISRKRR